MKKEGRDEYKNNEQRLTALSTFAIIKIIKLVLMDSDC